MGNHRNRVVCEVFNLIVLAASNLLILQDCLSMTLPLSRYRMRNLFKLEPHTWTEIGFWAQRSIDLIGF